MTSDYILNTKHYIGIGFLALSILLYFVNRKIYFLVFALTLTMGLIGFLDFFITNFEVGIAGVGINPLFLGLMVLFFAVSREQLNKIAPEKEVSAEKSLDENLIKSFEARFKDKTVAELEEIARQNSKFTPEAKAASKRILENKKKPEQTTTK